MTRAAVALAMALALLAPALAAAKAPRAGSLDRTFGVNGTTVTSTGKAQVFVGGVVNATGGGFYLAANTGGPPANVVGGRLLLLRYDSRGRLVDGFGNRGVAAHSLPQGSATVGALVRQRDGRLVLVGSVRAPGEPGNRNLLVARFSAAGKLDRTFSDDGLATTDLPGTGDVATDVVLQPDGALVVVGSVTPVFGQTGRSGEMVVARYRNDGQLDPSFGVGGVVRKGGDSYGSFLDAQAVALQSDGSIVVAGNTGINYRGTNQPMLARLRSDGSFDPTVVSPIPGIVSFGRDGESVQDMTLDKRRGRIYLAGRSFDEDFTTSSLYLAAAGTDLTLDPAFGVDGSVRTLFAGTSQDFATAVALDNKRRIVLAGSAADPPTGALALARFTRSGELDRRFGRKGRVRIKVGGGWNVARALAIQPKGRLLVAGNSRRDPSVETASAIALARLHGG